MNNHAKYCLGPLLSILCAFIVSSLFAQESEPLAIPADLASQVQQSIDLGRAIYFIDKASAIGTDVLMEKLKTLNDKRLGGYLTAQEGDDTGKPLVSWLVLFFTNEPSPRICYRIHIPMAQDKTPRLEEIQPPAQADPGVVALVRARQNAIAAAGPFQQPINPVVLPASLIGQEGILVELLAATNKPNLMVLGKHYRVVVSIDGQKVKSVTPLSKGILELPISREKGTNTVAMAATHIVTDYPLETHVFASMLHNLPLLLGTKRGIWKVDGDKISLVSDKFPEEK